MTRVARVPGTQSPRPRVKQYVEQVDDEPRPSRADAELRMEILGALKQGPLFLEQLRLQLHETPDRLRTILAVLREAGHVRLVGQRLAGRKWALMSHQPRQPVPVMPDTQLPKADKATAPRTSWWTEAPRAGFTAMGAADARRMAQAPESRMVSQMVIGSISQWPRR